MNIKAIIRSEHFYPSIACGAIAGMIVCAPAFTDSLRATADCVKAKAPFKRILKEACRMLPMLGFATVGIGAIILQQVRVHKAMTEASDTIARLSALAVPAATTIEHAVTNAPAVAPTPAPQQNVATPVENPDCGQEVRMVETITGQEFTSTMNRVDQLVNEFNRVLVSDGEAYLSELLDLYPMPHDSQLGNFLKFNYSGLKSELLSAHYKSQIEGNTIKVYIIYNRLPE